MVGRIWQARQNRHSGHSSSHINVLGISQLGHCQPYKNNALCKLCPCSLEVTGAVPVGNWESSNSCRMGHAVQVSNSESISGTVAVHWRIVLTPSYASRKSHISQITLTLDEEINIAQVVQRIFSNLQINGREKSWSCWYSLFKCISKKVTPY